MPDSIQDFAKKIKSKYSEYADVDDAELVEKIVRKHPVYANEVDLPKEFKLLHISTGYPNLDEIYERAGRENNVDPNLLLEQGRQETINFKPDVMYGRLDSPKAAKGAGQFMKGTAPLYGLTVNAQQDDREDPIKSINAQAKYMRKLLDEFNNDESLALAGYNSGEHRKALREGRVPNIPETQEYVKTIGEKLSLSRSQRKNLLRDLLGQQTPTQLPESSPQIIEQNTQPDDIRPGFSLNPDPSYYASQGITQPTNDLSFGDLRKKTADELARTKVAGRRKVLTARLESIDRQIAAGKNELAYAPNHGTEAATETTVVEPPQQSMLISPKESAIVKNVETNSANPAAKQSGQKTINQPTQKVASAESKQPEEFDPYKDNPELANALKLSEDEAMRQNGATDEQIATSRRIQETPKFTTSVNLRQKPANVTAKEWLIQESARQIAGKYGINPGDVETVLRKEKISSGNIADATSDFLDKSTDDQGNIKFEVLPEAIERMRRQTVNRTEYEAKKAKVAERVKNENISETQALFDEGLLTKTQFDEIQSDESKAKERYLKENPVPASGYSYNENFADTSAESFDSRKAERDLDIEEKIAEYGSLSNYYKEQERIREEYGTVDIDLGIGKVSVNTKRPFAASSEFAKNIGRYILKTPATAIKAGTIAYNDLNPLDQSSDSVKASETELYKFADDWNKKIDSSKNNDLREDFVVNELAESAGQLITQGVLGAVTGGASLLLPLAEAGVSQYEAADKAGANRSQRAIATLVGGLAAVPDALLKVKYLKALTPAAQSGFLAKLERTIFGELVEKIGEKEARNIAKTSITSLVKDFAKRGVENFGTEYLQEASEDVINKTAAKLTYAPETSWRDVVSPSEKEKRGYLAAGISGLFGGNIETVVERMSYDDLQNSDNLLAEALQKNLIDQGKAIQLAQAIKTKMDSEGVSLKPDGTVAQLAKKATEKLIKTLPQKTEEVSITPKENNEKTGKPKNQDTNRHEEVQNLAEGNPKPTGEEKTSSGDNNSTVSEGKPAPGKAVVQGIQLAPRENKKGEENNESQANTGGKSGESANPSAEPAEQEVSATAPAHEAATSPTNDLPEPTEAQIEAGNYRKGHITISGLQISVENPAGSERKGTDRDGKDWSVKMNQHYGYIKRSKGADTENIDIFVKDNTPENFSGNAYIVDQIHPDNGEFDEHKVLLGFDSEEEARAAYESNYAKDWKGLKDITAMSMPEFKQWTKETQIKPAAKNSSAGQISVVSEKLPTKADLYFGSPNSNGSFEQKYESSSYREGKSIFALQSIGNNQFEVFVDKKPTSTLMAKQYSDVTLRPLFDMLASEGKDLQTVQPAIVKLENGRYNLVSKGQVDFDGVGAKRLNEKPAAKSSKVEKPMTAGEEIKQLFDNGGEKNAYSKDLRNKQWKQVENGETKEAGATSNLLVTAKKVRAVGGLQTQEEFTDFTDDYMRSMANRTGAELQTAGRALIERWSPKTAATNLAVPETKSPVSATNDSKTQEYEQKIKLKTMFDKENIHLLPLNEYLQQASDFDVKDAFDELERIKNGEEKPPAGFTPETWEIQINGRYKDRSPSNIIDVKSFSRGHEQAVKEAIKRGEKIPAEVLADYPDLQENTANTKTYRVNNQDVKLSPEQLARWQKEIEPVQKRNKSRFDNQMRMAQNVEQKGDRKRAAVIREDANRDAKTDAMKLSALKREIAGVLTEKEQKSKDKRESGNYIGKDVSVDGVNGKVIGSPFGKVKVQFADGTEKTFEQNKINAPVAAKGKSELDKTEHLPEIVQRALESDVTDIGQLSKEEIAQLNAAIKKGILSKGKGGPFALAKTVYARPGFDFEADRKQQVDELQRLAEIDKKNNFTAPDSTITGIYSPGVLPIVRKIQDGEPYKYQGYDGKEYEISFEDYSFKASGDGATKIISGQDVQGIISDVLQEFRKPAEAKKFKFQPKNKKSILKSIIGEFAELSSAQTTDLQKAYDLEKKGVLSDDIYKLTGWERGKDGKFRSDLNDDASINHAKLREILLNNETAKLPEVFTSPKLFSAYPELKNINVAFERLGRNEVAYFDLDEKKIGLSNSLKFGRALVLSLGRGGGLTHTLTHEVQHAIQEIEGFNQGTNLKASGAVGYRNRAGEVEARNTEKRIDMTAEDRRNTPISKTEDVPRNKQLLKRVRTPEEVDAVKNIEGADLEDLLPKLGIELKPDGVSLELKNIESYEMFRRLVEDYEEQRATHFGGIFADSEQVGQFIKIVDNAVSDITEYGYDAEEISKLQNFADTLKTAADNSEKASGKKAVVVYLFDDAVPEEKWHYNSFVQAVNDDIESRLPKATNDKIAESEIFQNAEKFHQDYAGFPKAAKVEEFIAKAGSGQLDYLGVRSENDTELASAMLDWAEGFEEQNPGADLDKFAEISNYARKIIEQHRNIKRRTDERSRGDEKSVGDQPDADQQGRKTRTDQTTDERESAETERPANIKERQTIVSAENAGVIEKISGDVRYYEQKSRKENERKAQERIDEIGLSQAVVDAVNLKPTEGERADHIAFQMEVAKLLNRQANESDNEAFAKAKLHTAQEIVASIAESGTDFGQAISQLAAWQKTDPDAVAGYVQKRRAQNQFIQALTPEESKALRRSAEDLAEANAQLAEMQKKIDELEKQLAEPEKADDKPNNKIERSIQKAIKKNSEDALNRLKEKLNISKPILKMSLGEYRSAQLDENTLEDFASVGAEILLNDYRKNPITVDEFKKQMRNLFGSDINPHLTEIHALSQTELKRIKRENYRAQAVEALRNIEGNEDLTTEDLNDLVQRKLDEQKEKAKVHREHESEAKKFEKEKEEFAELDTLPSFAKSLFKVAATENKEALVGALLLETKQVLTADALARQLRKEFPNLSSREALNAASVAARSRRLAHEDLSAEKEKLKTEKSDKKLEALEVKRKRNTAQRELLNRIKFLENPPPSYGERVARLYKGALVSAVQTTVNNFLTAEASRKIVAASDLAEVLLNKGLAIFGAEYDYKGALPSNTRISDILGFPDGADKTISQLTAEFFTDAIFARGIANSVLDEYPTMYEALFGSYASDIAVLRDEAIKSGKVDSALQKVEKTYEKLNYLNYVQEFLVRSQEFNYALQLRLGRKGLNLKDVIAADQLLDKVSEEDLQFAVDRALKVTFAQSPEKGTVSDKLLNLYLKDTPALLSPFLVTFPKFIYNATSFVTDYAPGIGIAKASYKAFNGKSDKFTQRLAREANPKVVGQQLVGSIVFLATLGLVQFAGDDDKWYYLKTPFTDADGKNYYIDVRGYQPFASTVFLANKVNRLIHGKPMFTDGDTAVNETLEAMSGFSTKNLVENKPLQLTKYSLSWLADKAGIAEHNDENWERLSYIFQQQLGEIVGGFLRPAKTIKDLVAQFNDYESKQPDLVDKPLAQGISRSLPFANSIGNYTLGTEPKKDFVTGEESRATAPGLKIFGVNVVNPDFHKEIPSKALVLLRELTDTGDKPRDILPNAQRKSQVMGSLMRAMRDAGDDKVKQKEVAKAIKRAEESDILRAGQLDFIERRKGLNEMQSLAKGAKLDDVERVYKMSTDGEKRLLEPIIKKKKENLEKEEKLENRTILEKIKKMPTDKMAAMYEEIESDLSDQQKKDFKSLLREKASSANDKGTLTSEELSNVQKVIPDFKVPPALPKMKSMPSKFDSEYQSLEVKN